LAGDFLKFTTLIFTISILFGSLVLGEVSPWSIARGTGWNTYIQGGTGNYGQGFNNLLYLLDPEWQLGLAVQFGSSFVSPFLVLTYQP